jgi:hypothetical protein
VSPPVQDLPRSAARALRLRLCDVASRDGLAHQVARSLAPHPADLARIVHAFAFKGDERAFARVLLARRTQLWLYRTHQGAAGGDFVVVDRSARAPDQRRVWVVELKRGRPVRVGGGWQLRNAGAVIADLVARGALAPDTRFVPVTGDAGAVLAWLGNPGASS